MTFIRKLGRGSAPGPRYAQLHRAFLALPARLVLGLERHHLWEYEACARPVEPGSAALQGVVCHAGKRGSRGGAPRRLSKDHVADADGRSVV